MLFNLIIALIKNAVLTKDKEARYKLIEHNLRLVAHIVKKQITKEMN